MDSFAQYLANIPRSPYYTPEMSENNIKIAVIGKCAWGNLDSF